MPAPGPVIFPSHVYTLSDNQEPFRFDCLNTDAQNTSAYIRLESLFPHFCFQDLSLPGTLEELPEFRGEL